MTAEHDGTVEVGYCEGWDPQRGAALSPIPEHEARARDEAGEPYAVLLSADGRPRALFQVSWRDGYLGMFLFDEQGRRTREFDYRRLAPARLHLKRYHEVRHRTDSAAKGERSDGVEWRFTMDITSDGRAGRVLEYGGSLSMGARVPAEHRTVARAEFGAWTAYTDARMLGLDRPVTLVAASAATPERAPEGAPVATGGPAPEAVPAWSAPRPLAPRHLEAMFTAGSRLALDSGGIAVIDEPEHAGPLHLPTGSVLACDPCTLGDSDLPFTVTVPPGDHPLLIARMHWEGKDWGETPAAMLRVLDKPTATWELAVQSGQDARLLGTDEFFGFGVDTGTGCFLDAGGRDVLPGLFEADEVERRGWENGSRAYAAISDPDSGANLIAYHSGMGDGSYPVWIGRDADGAVTCFVADMLLLHRATALPPTLASAAVCVPPYAPPADDDQDQDHNQEAPLTDPGATAAFLSLQSAALVDFMAERQAQWR
ncbi:DUF4241 domain-containing protein [Streptomyces sp. NPDC002054]|uniref:DUF4241 domain-containing protein n=1 Tax=Streptomyces sp. NPDC002054 TaxID=3154663 RepID=UPI00332040D9